MTLRVKNIIIYTYSEKYMSEGLGIRRRRRAGHRDVMLVLQTAEK